MRSPYDTLANTQPEDMEMQKLVNKVQTEWHRRSDPHQGNGKKKVNEVQEDVDEVDDYSDSGDMVRPSRGLSVKVRTISVVQHADRSSTTASFAPTARYLITT